jgi:hypothetical protein
LAWLVVDTGLRFVPAEWLELRPVLVAARFPRPHGPFQPNLRLRTEKFTGEAALEGNVPTQEVRPPIHFGTDRLGFRLNPFLREGLSSEIVVWRGASFGYGAALSDDETFAAQLTRISGVPAYNGARFLGGDGFPEFDWLLSKLPSKPATAIYLHLEHGGIGHLRPARTELFGLGMPDPRERLELRYIYRVVTTWQRMSPLHILSSRVFKSVSDGAILPNPYEKALEPMRLPDGSALLMRRYEIESATRRYSPEAIQEIGQDVLWVREQLRSRGMNLLVVLIPSRLTVYAPWLEGWQGREAPARDYLNGLERVLGNQGIPVVNGLTVLREDVETAVAQGKLLYYRDDNHWNPDGVARVAEAVSARLDGIHSKASFNSDHRPFEATR